MSNQLLNEDMSVRLLNFRKQILEQAKIQFKGIGDQKKEVLKNILEEMLRPIDNTVGGNITQDLIRKFGDHGFKIEIVGYAKPFIKIDANNPYRYVINKVAWKDGPNVMQVHFYLNDKFPKFMKVREYDPKIYIRKLTNVERRLSQTYKPVDIADKQFAPIDVFISQVVYRQDGGKVTDAKYIIQPVDRMLTYTDIKNNHVNALDEVEAPTIAEALELLQAQIETCFYSNSYSPKYKVIAKKVLQIQPETNPDFSGDQVGGDDDGSSNSGEGDDDGSSNSGDDNAADEGEVLVEQEEVTDSDPMIVEDSSSASSSSIVDNHQE
jgi:hypothetical protein